MSELYLNLSRSVELHEKSKHAPTKHDTYRKTSCLDTPFIWTVEKIFNNKQETLKRLFDTAIGLISAVLLSVVLPIVGTIMLMRAYVIYRENQAYDAGKTNNHASSKKLSSSDKADSKKAQKEIKELKANLKAAELKEKEAEKHLHTTQEELRTVRAQFNELENNSIPHADLSDICDNATENFINNKSSANKHEHRLFKAFEHVHNTVASKLHLKHKQELEQVHLDHEQRMKSTNAGLQRLQEELNNAKGQNANPVNA
jgi:uncharacterized membrane protein YgaE (UPF0421/DUF939 family)